MNKHIKFKKSGKIGIKKSFTKEERLFMKRYPRLFMNCYIRNISKSTIDKVWHRLMWYMDKETFENAVKVVMIAKEENYSYKVGSRGWYYINLFKSLNIQI